MAGEDRRAVDLAEVLIQSWHALARLAMHQGQRHRGSQEVLGCANKPGSRHPPVVRSGPRLESNAILIPQWHTAFCMRSSRVLIIRWRWPPTLTATQRSEDPRTLIS